MADDDEMRRFLEGEPPADPVVISKGPPLPQPTAVEPAPSRGGRFWLTIAGGAVLIVAVGVGAVTWNSSRQVDAYCQVYDETSVAVADSLAAGTAALSKAKSADTMTEVETYLAASKELLGEMVDTLEERKAAAPAGLADSYQVVIDSFDLEGSTTERSLSEQKALDEAYESINQFAVDECDLPGDL